jgi:hypothetical protein
LASLVVAGFACIGFNRPTWSRSYTSSARFAVALVAHVFLYVMAMIVFYLLLRHVIHWYGGIETALVEAMAILTALALTLTLRVVPSLSVHVRATLQRMAGIPTHAEHFATMLADADFKANPSVHDEAQTMLLGRGIEAECDWLPLALPMNRLLFKATELFIQMRRWEDEAKFASFAVEARRDLHSLRRRFDLLSFRVSRTLTSIERLGEVRLLFSQTDRKVDTNQLDGLLRRIVADLIADSCDEITSFVDDACLLVARCAMTTYRTRKTRDALVASLGFVLKPRPIQFAYAALGYGLVMLYVGIWILFLILPPTASDLKFLERVGVVSLIVFGAMVIAIVPKLHWGFANSGLHERTPISFVIGAGICAMLFAIGINLVAGAIFVGGLEGALGRLHRGAPYLPSAFLTAATIAWLVQDHRWRDTQSPGRRRLRDGATLGAVWLVSSVVATFLIAHLQLVDISWMDLLKGTVGALALGFFIGYAIPEAVRVETVRTASITARATPYASDRTTAAMA